MKREFLILSFFSFLLLSGCSNRGSLDSELSAEPMDIPETLIVNADLPQNLPLNVSTYKVDYKDFDSNELLDFFDMKTVSHSERDAIGQRFESGNSLLYVYDDEGVLYGGFSYDRDLFVLDDAVIRTYYNINGRNMEVKTTGDFSDIKAISFLEEFEKGQLEIDRVYELSGEELEEFAKSSDEYAEQDVGTIHPEDKYELVFLSQILDGIPFMSLPWGGPVEQPTYTEAEVVICEDQVINIGFESLYDVEQEISNDKIISPETALNAFITDYNKQIQFDTTTITNISFNYVVTVDKDGMYAQPAYIFEYEYEAKVSNLPEPVTMEENKVISAVSGDFILSSEVGA